MREAPRISERLLAEARPGPPIPLAALGTAGAHDDAHPVQREQIERIKRAVPIAQVVGAYVELRGSGITLVGLCPFHEDHTPSFTVYPETATFHCYGCSAHGDVLNFLQRVEHLSFRQALSVLEGLQQHGEARPQ